MIYKLSKRKVVVATLLLLTATTMNNATLATTSDGNMMTKAWKSAKPFIHKFSPLGILGGLAMGGTYLWHKDNKKYLVYGAFLASGSILDRYFTRPAIKTDSFKGWHKLAIKYERYAALMPAILFTLYLGLKLLPKVLAYFELSEKLAPHKDTVEKVKYYSVILSAIAALKYFLVYICFAPSAQQRTLQKL